MPRLLPIIGLPLVADGILMLALKLGGRLDAGRAVLRESLLGDERR